MHNWLHDPALLRSLGIKLCHLKEPKIISITWLFPPPGWLKMNTDGVAIGTPGMANGKCIFWNSHGFVKGTFSISLVKAFAF